MLHPMNGAPPLSIQHSSSLGQCGRFVLLADQAMPDAIGYICMHTWPPIGTTEGTKQLVPPAMPKGVMCVCQQLCTGHKRWYVHPMLGQGGHGQAGRRTCSSLPHPIHLPQLPKLVGLIHILGQPAHPEVVNQRPILGYIGCSPHGYCPYRTHKTMAHYAIACHWTKQHSLCGSNGCTSCKVSWRANHGPAHTMYMASHPMAAWPIQAGQLHAHQRSATD